MMAATQSESVTADVDCILVFSDDKARHFQHTFRGGALGLFSWASCVVYIAAMVSRAARESPIVEALRKNPGHDVDHRPALSRREM
jgi:hypothetical protein